MSTATATAPSRAATDASWLRLLYASIALGSIGLVVFAYVGTFLSTISEGESVSRSSGPTVVVGGAEPAGHRSTTSSRTIAR